MVQIKRVSRGNTGLQIMQTDCLLMYVSDHFRFGHWHPITTAPYNRAVELRVLDHGNAVRLPFPCFRNNADHWINSDLGAPVSISPVEWRLWNHSTSRAG